LDRDQPQSCPHERTRLKNILSQVVPDDEGVIVRTADEGALGAELRARDGAPGCAVGADRGQAKSAQRARAAAWRAGSVRPRGARSVQRTFTSLIVSGEGPTGRLYGYINGVAPDPRER